MSVDLSVNLNKIALIRNSREGNYPSVEDFGRLCLDEGVEGLTVHPRPDQRHIRASDIPVLGRLVADYPGREFNIEGNPFAEALGSYPGFIQLVKNSRPHQCTLVPDTTAQLTSDHGFDLRADGERLKPVIEELKQLGIRVSLFMDPEPEQIELAAKCGADRIELYTGPYAESFRLQRPDLDALFARFADAAALAKSLGLGVNAGHDLNLANLPRFAAIPELQEVSIGHALTVDALHMGMVPAVRAYRAICQQRGKA